LQPTPVEGAMELPVEPATPTRQKWQRCLETLASDFWAWLPYFISASLLSAVLRFYLPFAAWINQTSGVPLQALTAMAYGFVLSISSSIDCFVILNWIGHISTPVVLAFLLLGGILDLRGLIMMVKGLGLKITAAWSALIVVNVLVFVLSAQLLMRW
jgi:uncharacterized protein